MTGKVSRPTISHAALWHLLLAFADFRIPKPVTELMVFPACIGKPAYRFMKDAGMVHSMDEFLALFRSDDNQSHPD